MHEHRHQRPLHAIGVVISLMGVFAIIFSVIVHNIPNAINDTIFLLLRTARSNLSHLHADYQYYLLIYMILSGLIVDVVGPRTVLIIAIAVSIIANYIFIHTTSMLVLLNCRLLINFMHIFILTGALTLGTHWLPRRHFSLYVGILTSILIAVPIFINPYIRNILIYSTLQNIMWGIDILGVIVIIGFILTERITDTTRYRHTLKGLFEPLTYNSVWLIGFVSMIGWTCNAIILSFGTFYIIKRFNMNLHDAFSIMKTVSICFGIGAIFMGLLSDIMSGRRYLLAIGYFLAALGFCVLLFLPSLSYLMALGLLCATSFFISSLIICYRKVNDYCTIGNSGITMGFILSMSVIGNMFFAGRMCVALQTCVNSNLPTNSANWYLVMLIVPVLLFVGAYIAATLFRPVNAKAEKFIPIARHNR